MSESDQPVLAEDIAIPSIGIEANTVEMASMTIDSQAINITEVKETTESISEEASKAEDTPQTTTASAVTTEEEKTPVAVETPANKVDIIPEDIKELTITNLDTGEEFVIGENDPDFEFDTFEIRGSDHEEGKGPEGAEGEGQEEATTAAAAAPAAPSMPGIGRGLFIMRLMNYLYGSSSSKAKTEAEAKMENENKKANSAKKTPFTKLSSFKFRKELGKGAFGRVLLAEAKTDGKLYALKIISKKNMRSSDKRQAKAERDILHAMTLKAPHPFTAGLKFAFQSENNLYLGMDYIPGGNLRELIKKFKCLPESWVRVYAAQLILAISHLHSLNVLYRDIKPHNVMIDARGHLVLIDFGLSKQEISHPRGALSLVGTPDYSAPEVLKTGVQQIEASNREKASSRKKKIPKSSALSKLPMIGYGKAADWWSLGIMIYEMLCGVPTFRGSDLRQTYQRILYADLEFVPEEKFSPAARLLLCGLIKRDPALRMGAWENPPQDIMGSPFFIGIRWEAIYERRVDGPWIPEVPVFGKSSSKSRKTSVASADLATAAEDHAADRREGEHRDERDVFLDYNTAHKSQKIERPLPSEADDEEEEGSSGSGTGSEEEEDGEYMNSKGMRDSVFFASRGQLENKLLDWSFMDEQVLKSTLEAEEKNAAEEEESRRRKEEKLAARARRQLEAVKESETSGAGSGDEESEPATPGEQAAAPSTEQDTVVEPTVAAEDVVLEVPSEAPQQVDVSA